MLQSPDLTEGQTRQFEIPFPIAEVAHQLAVPQHVARNFRMVIQRDDKEPVLIESGVSLLDLGWKMEPGQVVQLLVECVVKRAPFFAVLRVRPLEEPAAEPAETQAVAEAVLPRSRGGRAARRHRSMTCDNAGTPAARATSSRCSGQAVSSCPVAGTTNEDQPGGSGREAGLPQTSQVTAAEAGAEVRMSSGMSRVDHPGSGVSMLSGFRSSASSASALSS